MCGCEAVSLGWPTQPGYQHQSQLTLIGRYTHPPTRITRFVPRDVDKRNVALVSLLVMFVFHPTNLNFIRLCESITRIRCAVNRLRGSG